MTNKELRDLLATMPDDAEVTTYSEWSGYEAPGFRDLELRDISMDESGNIVMLV